MDSVEKIQKYLHKIPHLNFKFRPLNDWRFDVDPRGEYAKSILFFACASLCVAFFFLLLTTIAWIFQCCKVRKSTPIRSSRSHMRRLSTALFSISVVCFSLLGCCLYGNEHLNKSIQAAINGLNDFNSKFLSSFQHANKLNHTQLLATTHMDELSVLIEKKSHQFTKINETVLREADSLLTTISDRIFNAKKEISKLIEVLSGIDLLVYSQKFGERLEYERWLCSLVLLIIVISVLFVGVISFCRQSKGGATIFSGLGIIIFVVAWIMFSLIFPLTIAYADFCVDGQEYIRLKLNKDLYDFLKFYMNCASRENQDVSLSNLRIEQLNSYYTEIMKSHDKLEVALYILFNNSPDVTNATNKFSQDVLSTFKFIGALDYTLSCYNMRQNIQETKLAFCHNGFIGLLIICAALFLLCFSIFILLILVSKSWNIFSRSGSDYLEVVDDDNFTPRGQDTMPENIYDTNIFNPRARQHLANTIDVTHRNPDGYLNGSPPALNYHHSSQMDLNMNINPNLDRNGWQQQIMAHNATSATAPHIPPALLEMNDGNFSTLLRNGSLLRTANNYHQLNSAGNVYERYQGRELQEFQNI